MIILSFEHERWSIFIRDRKMAESRIKRSLRSQLTSEIPFRLLFVTIHHNVELLRKSSIALPSDDSAMNNDRDIDSISISIGQFKIIQLQLEKWAGRHHVAIDKDWNALIHSYFFVYFSIFCFSYHNSDYDDNILIIRFRLVGSPAFRKWMSHLIIHGFVLDLIFFTGLHCQQFLEYADWIPCSGVILDWVVQERTLNRLWWWGSTFGDQGVWRTLSLPLL